MILTFRAFIVTTCGWIGAHDKKIGTREQTLVAGPGGKDSNIAGLYLHGSPIVAAKAHGAPAPCDAENFVNSGVVMDVIVYSVAPGISPTVHLEELFHNCRGIEIVRKSDCTAIEDQRPICVIGNN